MKFFALITPDDVLSFISLDFMSHKELKAHYINIIRKCIISRIFEVIKYHCFVMIFIYCPGVLFRFNEEEIHKLLDKIEK